MRIEVRIPGKKVVLIGPDALQRRIIRSLIKPVRVTEEVVVPDLIHRFESTRVRIDEVWIHTINGKALAESNTFTDGIDQIVHDFIIKTEHDNLGVLKFLYRPTEYAQPGVSSVSRTFTTCQLERRKNSLVATPFPKPQEYAVDLDQSKTLSVSVDLVKDQRARLLEARVQNSGLREREKAMKKFFVLSLLALVTMLSGTAFAQKPVTVGGAPMFANKNIIENAVNSKDHTTLVAAVKAAGLVETLQGPGPFTVFAPVNAAFDALPAGTVDTLLKPENKGTLTSVLTYHVIAARLNSKGLERMIKQGGGRAILKTVQGGELTATMSGGDINITDAKGNMARITITNVNQSNGVIHVVDRVLLPQERM